MLTVCPLLNGFLYLLNILSMNTLSPPHPVVVYPSLYLAQDSQATVKSVEA